MAYKSSYKPPPGVAGHRRALRRTVGLVHVVRVAEDLEIHLDHVDGRGPNEAFVEDAEGDLLFLKRIASKGDDL